MANNDVPEIYADGISDIGLANGMLRIDLYSLAAVASENSEAPAKAVRQRVIMSPQSFLESFSTMQAMFKKLEEAGILQRNDSVASKKPAETDEEVASNTKKSKPKSPNFE